MENNWKMELREVLLLFGMWFLCSYVSGIMLVDWLNGHDIQGLLIGKWLGENSAIVLFAFICYKVLWKSANQERFELIKSF